MKKILIIALAVITLIAGWWFLKLEPLKEYEKEEVGKWNTYENEEYGYQFNYPTKLKAKELSIEGQDDVLYQTIFEESEYAEDTPVSERINIIYSLLPSKSTADSLKNWFSDRYPEVPTLDQFEKEEITIGNKSVLRTRESDDIAYIEYSFFSMGGYMHSFSFNGVLDDHRYETKKETVYQTIKTFSSIVTE